MYIHQIRQALCAVMHRLRWDDLQFVRAVAQQGSLSAAARELGVNHATVLRRITALEADLGLVLFDRPPGGYRIRPDVQEFLSEVQAMGQSAERLQRIVPTIGKGLEGPFRVTTTDSFADAILPRHLRDLSRQHPKLSIELIVSNQPLDMNRPVAEITIRPARILPDGLAGTRAGTMTFAVFGSREYLSGNSSARHADHRWLGVAPPLSRSPVWAWQESALANDVVTRADSFIALARMVETGLGLAMLPSFLTSTCPGLEPAPQFTDRLETAVWVATHPDLAATPRVQAIMTFFVQALAADPAFTDDQSQAVV